ncbi:MAG: DUF4442 domain-containing protein [Ginsengibacter sp.]
MNEFIKLSNNSFKFRMYLLFKLPAAFFSGVKIQNCTPKQCTTTVPYKWLTQNPFRSTYFASLAMAAEMSTGALALSHIYKKKPAVSMLVTRMEVNYFKKATGVTYFTCSEGNQISNAIEEAISTNRGTTVSIKSLGQNKNGETIAEFIFTWSFKTKVTS